MRLPIRFPDESSLLLDGNDGRLSDASDEGWTVVSHRRRFGTRSVPSQARFPAEKYAASDRQGRRQGGEIGWQDYFTVYVTNFPVDATTKVLGHKLSGCGLLREVFIRAKLNREGKRFAFVHFFRVSERFEVLWRVKEKWVGNFKLLATPSKFGFPLDKKQVVHRNRVQKIVRPS